MNERLNFIRKIRTERGIKEIFSGNEASSDGFVILGKNPANHGTDGFF